MSNSTATIPAEVQELLNLAASDYDAFWASLDAHDKDLTKALTCNEDYDAVFVLEGVVWELSYNEVTEEFEPHELGPVSELTLYADLELTGLENNDQLDEFVSELRHMSGLSVVKGCNSHGRSGAEWLIENRYIKQAWTDAMEAI